MYQWIDDINRTIKLYKFINLHALLYCMYCTPHQTLNWPDQAEESYLYPQEKLLTESRILATGVRSREQRNIDSRLVQASGNQELSTINTHSYDGWGQ